MESILNMHNINRSSSSPRATPLTHTPIPRVHPYAALAVIYLSRDGKTATADQENR